MTLFYATWRDALEIPAPGDSIAIAHDIEVGGTAPASALRVTVQPRSSSGVLTEHARAIGDLLQFTHDDAARLLNDAYLKPSLQEPAAKRALYDLKSLLGNYESLLEYTAHHLADFCSRRPSDRAISFPIRKMSDT